MTPTPTLAEHHLERAFALKAQQHFRIALEECEAALRLEPHFRDAHNLRGILLEELGRKAEAVAAYREAVRLDPDFQEAQENLAEAERELAEAIDRPLTPAAQQFGPRALAYVIDVVVLYALSFATGFMGVILVSIPLVVINAVMGSAFYFTGEFAPWLNWPVGVGLSTFYFFIFEWLYGGTFGKLILRLRVIKSNGQPCDLRAALVRGLYRHIDALLFGLPAYLNMQPPWYQRLGDKRAQTLVVSANATLIQRRRSGWLFILALGLYGIIASGTWGLLLGTTIK